MITILETVVGSTLHGIAVNDGLEDTDYMGVCIEDKKKLIGLAEWKGTIVERTKPEGVRSEAGDVDRVTYGLRKYLRLALGGNPSVLLPLFAPTQFITQCTTEGDELRGLASKIVSAKIRTPFMGYARQQHERMLGLRGQRNVTRPELVDKYGYDTKYASHIIRLCIQGMELLSCGKLSLPMAEPDAKFLRGIRKGALKLGEVSEVILDYENKLATCPTMLPAEPDYEFVENWMTDKYMHYWMNDGE